MKIILNLALVFVLFMGIGMSNFSFAQFQPNTHPIQTACVAVNPDGSETTVGYSNDCDPGGDGCIDNTCPGAGVGN